MNELYSLISTGWSVLIDSSAPQISFCARRPSSSVTTGSASPLITSRKWFPWSTYSSRPVNPSAATIFFEIAVQETQLVRAISSPRHLWGQ